jgi:hypothetical protein
MHASRSKGAGLEFAQYRAYEPGDEPRRIDWKLFARSDKFFVREAEEESPIAIWILLDASASMAQADRVRPDWSRFDAAKLLGLIVDQSKVQSENVNYNIGDTPLSPDEWEREFAADKDAVGTPAPTPARPN